MPLFTQYKMSFHGILLGFCLLFAGGLRGQSESSYEAITDSLIEANQIEAMVDYYTKEVKAHPKSVEARRQLGVAYLYKQDYAKARIYVNEAIKMKRNCARCYYNLAYMEMVEANNVEALRLIEQAIAFDSLESKYIARRAMIKEAMNDRIGARRDYNKAIEIDPENSNNYLYRAQYYIKIKIPAFALSDLEMAIDLDAKNDEALYYAFQLYFQKKEMSSAMKSIDAALALKPQSTRYYYARGFLLGELGEYTSALSDYTTAIELDSTNGYAYANRAFVHYALEDLDASCGDRWQLKALIDRGLFLDSSYISDNVDLMMDYCDSTVPSFYYQRGVGYYNLGEYEKSIEWYDRCLKQFPDNKMALSFKGNALMRLERYNDALVYYYDCRDNLEAYRDAAKYSRNLRYLPEDELKVYVSQVDAFNDYSMAECYFNLNQMDSAYKYIQFGLEKSIESSKYHVELFYTLRALIYMNQGQYERALNDVHRSISINRNYAKPYLIRALLKFYQTETIDAQQLQVISVQSNAQISFMMPSKKKIAAQREAYVRIIEDCTSAINFDPNEGLAYELRGVVKQILGQSDYCYDLLKAEELGMLMNEYVMAGCR